MSRRRRGGSEVWPRMKRRGGGRRALATYRRSVAGLAQLSAVAEQVGEVLYAFGQAVIGVALGVGRVCRAVELAAARRREYVLTGPATVGAGREGSEFPLRLSEGEQWLPVDLVEAALADPSVAALLGLTEVELRAALARGRDGEVPRRVDVVVAAPET